MKKLVELYNTDIATEMKKAFNYANNLAVPKITKVSLNVGLGKYKENQKLLSLVSQDIFLITGQKAQITRAKKAISGFKIKAGDIVGLRVTLRGKKMYDFLEKMIRIVLPRTRDFRGISIKSLDASGNYTLAVREHIVFPEIEYERVETIYGLQISLSINTKKSAESQKLMELLGFPFKKPKVGKKQG